MLHRLDGQHFGLHPGLLHPQDRDEGRLARRRVLAHGLPDDGFLALGVQEVVDDLEGESEVVGVGPKRMAHGLRRLVHDGAGLAGKGDQLAGLEPFHPGNGPDVQGLVLGEQVDHLPADHAATAAGGAEPGRQLAAHGRVRVGGGIDQHLEGQRQQRIAREDGGRLAELDVTGRLAAAKIVVVHGRQVVMDQGIAVHQLDRRADAQGAALGHAEHAGGGQYEKRPKALAPVQGGIAHGRENPRLGPVGFFGQQALDGLVDRLRGPA